VNIGLLILRLVIGGLFIGHGSQKLFGWFGGGGPVGTGAFFDKLGYRPGPAMAALAGVAEAVGGSLLVLGFLTPAACGAIIGVMTNAIMAVHRPNGMWNTNGGMEFPLVMAASATAIAFDGPGRISLDVAIGWHLWGVLWGLTVLLAGVIAATVLLSLRAGRLRTEASGEERSDRPQRRAA